MNNASEVRLKLEQALCEVFEYLPGGKKESGKEAARWNIRRYFPKTDKPAPDELRSCSKNLKVALAAIASALIPCDQFGHGYIQALEDFITELHSAVDKHIPIGTTRSYDNNQAKSWNSKLLSNLARVARAGIF